MNELLRKFFAPGVPSEQWALNKYDYIKAVVISIFAPVFMLAIQWLNNFFNNQPFVWDWPLLGKTAGACLLSYLTKNYLSPSQNPPLK